MSLLALIMILILVWACDNHKTFLGHKRSLGSWSFHWSMWICILLCSVVLKFINNRSKKDKIGDTHWYKSELCWCWCKMWMFKISMHTSFLCCFYLLIFFLTYSAGLRWNFWKLSVWNYMITAFPVSEYVIGSLGHVFSSGKLYFFG